MVKWEGGGNSIGNTGTGTPRATLLGDVVNSKLLLLTETQYYTEIMRVLIRYYSTSLIFNERFKVIHSHLLLFCGK